MRAAVEAGTGSPLAPTNRTTGAAKEPADAMEPAEIEPSQVVAVERGGHPVGRIVYNG
jgi:hypothetical protein